MRYDDNDIPVTVEEAPSPRRVRTVPGSTLRGGLRPWVQAFEMHVYRDFAGRPLVTESGFSYPFRTR